MSLLTRIFGSQDQNGPARTKAVAETGAGVDSGAMKTASFPRQGISLTLDILKQLFPIRTLSEEELSAFVWERKAEAYQCGTVLFRIGEPVESIHYLLQGTVLMDLGDGNAYEVTAGTAKARFPLCCGKQYSATAHAQTDVHILRVAGTIMNRGIARPRPAPLLIDPGDDRIPAAVRESRLFQAFAQSYNDEDLKIPSLPDVAFKLRTAMRHDIDIREAVRIIELDPAVAAKLVHVANSPLYLPVRPINNCYDAVLRLGLTATRNLVTSFCLREVFRSQDFYLNQVLKQQWKSGIKLSSLCYILAGESEGVSGEEALLAGLVADIGVIPFLYFAEKFPREYWSPEDVASAIPYIRGPVGAFLLKSWDFPADLIEIPIVAEEWYHDSCNALTLSDIVILSKLHSYIGTRRMAELPAINSIPACAKLKDGRLSPTYTLKVLHDAGDQIRKIVMFLET